MTKAKKGTARTTETGNLVEIKRFLETKLAWVERAAKKEEESGEKTELTLSQFLNKELEKSVDTEEQAYANALNARTHDQKHEAIMAVIAARKSALTGTTAQEEVEEEDQEMEGELKAPRKKGYLEVTFDSLSAAYEEKPDTEVREKLLDLIAKLEVNRRVRFLYDLQKLRIGATNRSSIYAQQFGVKDLFIDYAGDQLGRLERHNEKMVDRILVRSPDKDFYEYLTSTYLGLGTMMSGCIISELSAPERFRSVSALWAYCGLKVVGNDPDSGQGGYAQRKERGGTAGWNHFLRTKLLGVLSGCMIKAQTRYIGTPDEAPKARNVKVLNDYKQRLATKNNLVDESARVYNSKGKEIFQYNSAKPLDWYDKDGKKKGTITPSSIQRRSKAHINKMATRYMIKMFLADILNKWRVLHGCEPFLTYDEAKLRNGVPHAGLNINPRRPRIEIRDQA